MKISKTIIFLILTISLTGYVYFYEYKNQQALENTKSHKILQFDVDQINYFQLIKPEGKIAFQKSDTGWTLLEPILENADNDKVSELLSSLAQEQIETVIKKTDSQFTETDLAEYGLDKPAIVFNFKNNLGTTTKVSVGSIRNFEGQSYVSIDSKSEIWLGSTNWFNRSLEKLIDYRDKRLFRENLAQVKAIKMNTLQDKIELTRSGNTWKSNLHDYALDQIIIRDILKKISDSQIEEYIFEGEPSMSLLKQTGMDQAVVSLDLITDKGVWSARLHVEKQQGQLYLLSERPTYLARVSPLIWEALSALTLDSLRDRSSAFLFAADEVKNIYMKNSNLETNFIFNSGAWLMGPKGGPYVNIDKSRVSSHIKKMHELKITDFIDRDVREQFVGDQMLILKSDRDKLLLQLNWGPSFKMQNRGREIEYYYARTQHSAQIFAMEKSVIDELQLKTDEVSTQKPQPPEAIESTEK